MLRVLFTAAARADLDDALKWYEARAPEIAPQFREALRAVVARIAEPQAVPRLAASNAPGAFASIPLYSDFPRGSRHGVCRRRLAHEPRPDSMAATDVMIGD